MSALALADPHVVERLGRPVVVLPGVVRGRLAVDDSAGEARLEFLAGGSKAQSRVRVAADRQGGTWSLLNVELRGDED